MKKSIFDLQFQGGSSSSSLYLPDEIILKIITRHPAKSVGRFRCVSKHWRNILSQPRFIKTHLNLSLNNPPYKALVISPHQRYFLVVDFHNTTHLGNDRFFFATYPIKIDLSINIWEWVRFRCSHNGLVFATHHDILLLLNPTTLEWREFPKPPHFVAELTFGMGNDKAVAIKRNDCSTAYVYAFKHNTTSTWKRLQIQNSLGNIGFAVIANGVLFNGSIYWLGCTGTMIAFDLTEETMRAIPAPISQPWIIAKSTLGIVGGSLCIISQGNWENTSSKLDVWVMNEYDMEEPWTKISFYQNMKYGLLRVIFLGNEEFMLISYDRSNSKAVIYNIKEKSSRDIVVSGLPKVDGCCTFVDSLVSPGQLL